MTAPARSPRLPASWEEVCGRVTPERLLVVAVDGRSGAGKTTCADRLRTDAAARLGCPAEAVGLVAVEDMYAGWDGLAAGPALLERCVLAPLAGGAGVVSWPCWDWEAGAYRRTGRLERPSSGLLLVEGVGCSAPPARALVDHTFWLEAPEPARRAAVRRREERADGEPSDRWWPGWAAAEERLLAQHPPVWDECLEGVLP